MLDAFLALGEVEAAGAAPPLASPPPRARPALRATPARDTAARRAIRPRRTGQPDLATQPAMDLPAARPPDAAEWQSPPQHQIPRRRRPAVLFGSAACLVLLLGALAFAMAGGPSQPAATTAAAPPPPPAPGANTPPAPPVQPGSAQPGPVQLEETVRTYYGLLPGDTATGWQYLGTPERAKTGSFAAYNDFWSGIDRVGIRGPVTVQGDTVLVNLQFEPKNRGPTFERYRLTMSTAPDGRVLIESAKMVGTFALAGR